VHSYLPFSAHFCFLVTPSCEEIELESHSEFKILANDKFLRVEIDSEDLFILYLQYSFGFKLYKREFSENLTNTNNWELVFDNSDIN
jgi:hypothetical protein